jgi:hypothetical protein
LVSQLRQKPAAALRRTPAAEQFVKAQTPRIFRKSGPFR